MFLTMTKYFINITHVITAIVYSDVINNISTENIKAEKNIAR